ncbi:MAG: hypothetical protein ACOC22_04845 [bacterium]
MNINEIFEILQDNIEQDEINGELTLCDSYIVWSYDLYNEDIEEDVEYDDDEDFLFSFEFTSSEEKLMEIYQTDIEIIERIVDDFDEKGWEFSEPKILKTSISFKIQ